MKHSGNVNNGLRNRLLHFGDVPDPGQTLNFEQPKIRRQEALIIKTKLYSIILLLPIYCITGVMSCLAESCALLVLFLDL